MANESGNCFMCVERGECKCNVCKRKVCVYHSSIRKQKYEEFVSCDMCKINAVRSEISKEVQNGLEERKNKLIGHVAATEKLEEEITELQRIELITLDLVDNLTKDHVEIVENIKSKLVLEERSTNNAKATYENIYNAIESQQNRVDLLVKELEEVESEIESMKMIIEHKEFENQEISREIRIMFNESKLCIDLDTAEKILCDKCKVNALGTGEFVSVLNWATQRSSKGCSSCILF